MRLSPADPSSPVSNTLPRHSAMWSLLPVIVPKHNYETGNLAYQFTSCLKGEKILSLEGLQVVSQGLMMDRAKFLL
jgi:hypothetical protein